MSEPRIVKAEIGPYPKSFLDAITTGMPKVTATFNDGTQKVLFDFYPDEISFTEQELVGLTAREAISLKGKKDVAYLQS